MNIKIVKYLSIFLLIAVFSALNLRAEGVGGKKADALSRTFGEPANTHFNINLISTWLYSNAVSDINQAGNSGFVYPKGSNRAVFFTSGFIFGGVVQGEIRVGGTAYRTGMTAGAVINGVPEDPNADDVRIYRVRPDFATANLSFEVQDGDGVSQDAVRAQYELDWNNWPAAKGAPYEDVDGNGSYDPTVDIPGVPGSDQTIWHVCNDFDPGQTDYLYGSLPMGLEIQYTYWGYNTTGALGSTMFRKYLMINKNPDGLDFTDMYVSMWSDPDLGDASDDFAGCDTTTSLGFIYNANAYDAQYEYNPPAGGFDFFQGPIIDGAPSDEAIYKGQRVQGKINLGMSAFYFFINSDAVYTDPRQGEYARGTLGFYNLFQGRISTTGAPFPVPAEAGGGTTALCLSGDPITRTGWIDGMQHPPGDRRIGQVAGPFVMAFGDTQEVVVAQIAAGAIPGVDRLGALGMLKFFDLEAQLTYDNFFNVPTAPLAPVVEVTELDKEIILDWSVDRNVVETTESHDELGFAFQGYNVYQLPSASATIQEAVRIATFDKVDFIAKIEGLEFDPATGVVATKVKQFGTDSGIQRFLSITTDALRSNAPLINGTRYYFAVTAYAFNPDPDAVPNNLENPIAIFTVIPQDMKPGNRIYTESGETNTAAHATGTANAQVNWEVVDPTKVTGDDYEVFFNLQHYYLDVDGIWKETAYPDQVGKRGVDDLSTAYLTGTIVTSTTVGTADVMLVVEGIGDSPDGSWCDGVLVTFPPGIVINSASNTSAGGADQTIDYVTNSVLFGDNEVSGYGQFHGGGEVLTININIPTLPMTIAYEIYDDGYAYVYGLGGTVVDAIGTVAIAEMGYSFKTENHWNVRNVTTSEVVLDDQKIIADVDIYDGTTYYSYQSHSFEGLQVWMSAGSYETPINYYQISLVSPTGLSTLTAGAAATTTAIDLNNYTIFSGTTDSWAISNFGFGTDVIEELQQDYELRFTGVWAERTLGDGRTYHYIESGGQMGTLFLGLSSQAIMDHPDNPNPGVDQDFLVRIPFEVWNVDDPGNEYQVNFMFRDRLQSAADDPMYCWNTANRMYGVIVNSPYDENTVIPGAVDPLSDNATWVLVFYGTNYHIGDIVSVVYANPLQLGVDTYTFTAPDAQTYDAELAKDDIANDLNVFPNPYYGVNSQELNKYQRFVTFSHLPQNATIRIFNLAGQLVRAIDKDNEDQFQRWDLLNQTGLPVASGLYIAYVDMPDLGTTKVLKLAVIQEQQILDRF
jgi:hypothetical protein